MSEIKCCFDGCDEKADFEIIEDNDYQDYYSRITHACQSHVGDLLGTGMPCPVMTTKWLVDLLDPKLAREEQS
jgi:hypothetical protein